MHESNIRTIEVLLDEDERHTEAEVLLSHAGKTFTGWGRSRRNPRDPDVPKIGEEIAMARALFDLAHQLMGAAADSIEQFEGRPVHLHG
jgi:hypothetical protein